MLVRSRAASIAHMCLDKDLLKVNYVFLQRFARDLHSSGSRLCVKMSEYVHPNPSTALSRMNYDAYTKQRTIDTATDVPCICK